MQYEQALSLLGSELDPEALTQLKNNLARRYLDTETAQSVMAREAQINAQQQQVLSYQQGLERLEHNLTTERNSTQAQLSEAEW
jgi:hypothetical protein